MNSLCRCGVRVLRAYRPLSYCNLLLSRGLAQNGDHYETLGIPRTASRHQIRSAFLQLSKKYHPDTRSDQKDSSDEFHVISEAYKVLSNREKKLEYDYSLLRRDNPSVPPPDDVMAQFYRDGTIYTGPKERVDTGYTNAQIVLLIALVSTAAAIVQIVRARAVARRRNAWDEVTHQQAVAEVEALRLRAEAGQTPLQTELAEYRKSVDGHEDIDTEIIVDKAGSI